MSRLLTKAAERAVGDTGRDRAMGIYLSSFPSSRQPQSIYLEGYGVLFLLNVRFPLVAPPAKAEEKTSKPADSPWEQTKREVFGRREPNQQWTVSSPRNSATLKYDAERVGALKKELLEALKSATNIRRLAAADTIIVAVLGSESAPAVHVTRSSNTRGEVAKTVERVDVIKAEQMGRTSSRQSAMTLRVKRSDTEEYSQGKLSPDEFARKANIVTY